MILELKDLQIENLKKMKNKKIIYFYSSFNIKSNLIFETIEEISELYQKKDNIFFYKVDVSYNPKLTNFFQIKNIPFVIFIDENNKIIDFLEKEINEETLIENCKNNFPLKSTFKEIIFNMFKKKENIKDE